MFINMQPRGCSGCFTAVMLFVNQISLQVVSIETYVEPDLTRDDKQG